MNSETLYRRVPVSEETPKVKRKYKTNIGYLYFDPLVKRWYYYNDYGLEINAQPQWWEEPDNFEFDYGPQSQWGFAIQLNKDLTKVTLLQHGGYSSEELRTTREIVTKIYNDLGNVLGEPVTGIVLTEQQSGKTVAEKIAELQDRIAELEERQRMLNVPQVDISIK